MGGKIPLGFTIVETLIVLAISGVMLTVAFSFISGKQSQTEFSQGIRQIVSNLQLEISQVQTGTYTNNNSDTNCSQTINSTQVVLTSGANTNPGSSNGCEYIGEVFQFDPTINNVNQSGQYIIYPVISNQYIIGGDLGGVIDLHKISLCALYEPKANNSPCSPKGTDVNLDSYQTHTLPYGIKVSKITSAKVASVGSMLAYYNIAATGDILDCEYNPLGSRSGGGLGVDLLPFNSSVSLGTNTAIASEDISGQSIPSPTPADGPLCDPNSYYGGTTTYNQPIDICLNSGTNNQSGIITLGGGNNPTSVSLTIKSTPC